MKRILVLFFLLCATPALADGLDTFLNNLGVQAAADRNGFAVNVGTHFGIPRTRVDLVMGSVGSPADAFMIFQLGRMTGWPEERIMPVYNRHRGQGWGVMAQEMGIKPGSREFHALKNGDFGYSMPHPQGGGQHHKEHGNGQGKGKKK
jgi:hypothetical protein